MRFSFGKVGVVIGSAALAALLTGCVSSQVESPSVAQTREIQPEERGSIVGAGFESQDLAVVADKMVRGILAVPQIARSRGTPRVVLDPVINETRFAINREIFLNCVRAELNSKATGKALFLPHDQRSTQIRPVLNAADLGDVDYLLTGKISTIPTRTARGVSGYVLYTYQLIDTHTGDIVWEDMAEIRKEGLEEAAYR